MRQKQTDRQTTQGDEGQRGKRDRPSASAAGGRGREGAASERPCISLLIVQVAVCLGSHSPGNQLRVTEDPPSLPLPPPPPRLFSTLPLPPYLCLSVCLSSSLSILPTCSSFSSLLSTAFIVTFLFLLLFLLLPFLLIISFPPHYHPFLSSFPFLPLSIPPMLLL